MIWRLGSDDFRGRCGPKEYSSNYFAREYEDLRFTQCQNKCHVLGKHTYVYGLK